MANWRQMSKSMCAGNESYLYILPIWHAIKEKSHLQHNEPSS